MSSSEIAQRATRWLEITDWRTFRRGGVAIVAAAAAPVGGPPGPTGASGPPSLLPSELFSCPDAIGFGRAAREATFEVVRALRVGPCRRRAGGATAGC
jgi:hypothetical protein